MIVGAQRTRTTLPIAKIDEADTVDVARESARILEVSFIVVRMKRLE